MGINWGALKIEDAKKIDTIVEKFLKLMLSVGAFVVPSFDLTMDVSAAHVTKELDLDKLLAADDFNLVHDVLGIHNHLDHETGTTGLFVPRYQKE